VDIQSPDDEDIALLRDKFGFHPLAIEDTKRPEGRPKVNIYKPPKPSQPEKPEDGKSEEEAPAAQKITATISWCSTKRTWIKTKSVS